MRTDITIDHKKVFCANASEIGFSQKTLYCGERFIFNNNGHDRIGRMIGRVKACSKTDLSVGMIIAIGLTPDLGLVERFVDPNDVVRTVHGIGDYDKALESVTELLTLDVKAHNPNKIRHFVSEGFPSLREFESRHSSTHLVDYDDPETLKRIDK